MLWEESFLDTGNAWNLFMPKSVARKDCNNHAEVILSAIIVHMEICQKGSTESWHLAVKNTNADDEVTQLQKDRIKYKCQYLFSALNIARREMVKSIKDHKRVKWRDCTSLAIDTLSDIDVDHISHPEMVEEWHNHFAHPNLFIAAGCSAQLIPTPKG